MGPDQICCTGRLSHFFHVALTRYKQHDMSAPSILLVEDEQAIADTIIFALKRENMTIKHCQLGQDALDSLRIHPPHLVILNIGLPDICGFEVCRTLRTFSDIPVIFLTARHEEVDRVVGLELGADDYVVKPFSPRELAARVRGILRRTHRPAESPPQHNTRPADPQPVFTQNTESARITYHNTYLDLTRYEYYLLACLLQHPGRIYSRAQLMEQVWHDALDTHDRTVDTHIKTLRAKLRAVTPHHDPIRTHRGMGYSLEY